MKRIKSDHRASLTTENLSNCMAVHLETEAIEVFDPEPALNLWWEAKLRRLGGKGRGKTKKRKRVERSDNVDVIEVDESEEEEEQDGEDYFYNSPSEDEGECVRKKGCEESESEDECISEVESD